MARKGKKMKEPQVEGIIEIGKTGVIIHLKDGKENQKIVLPKNQTNSSNAPLRSSKRKSPENKENVEKMPTKVRNGSENVQNVKNVESGPTENCNKLLTPINNTTMENSRLANSSVDKNSAIKIPKQKLNSHLTINIKKIDSFEQKKGEERQNTNRAASDENARKKNAHCTKNRTSKVVQIGKIPSENVLQKKNKLKPKNGENGSGTVQAKTPTGNSTLKRSFKGKTPKTTKRLNKSSEKTGGSRSTTKAMPPVSRQTGRKAKNIRGTRNRTLKQNQVGGKNEVYRMPQKESGLKRKIVQDTAGPARKESCSSTSEDERSASLSSDFKPLKVIDAGKHKNLWVYVMTFVNSQGKRKKVYLKDVEAENKYPQLVINFFKDRVKWKSHIIVT